MPPVELDSTIPVSERLQTYALDRVATSIGNIYKTYYKINS